MIHETNFALLKRVWMVISAKRKRAISVLFFGMLLATFFETVGLASVIPFVSVLANPDILNTNTYLSSVMAFFGVMTQPQQTKIIILAYLIMVVLSGLVRTSVFWISTRLSHSIGGDISYEMFRRTLYQPYSVHVRRNSSELISGIVAKTDAVTYVITHTLLMINSLLVVVAIITLLLFVNATAVVAVAGSLAVFYYVLTRSVKPMLQLRSEIVAKNQDNIVKVLQEGLGGIRDIILDATQQYFCGKYHKLDSAMRRAKGDVAVVSTLPRYSIETFAIIVLSLFAYYMFQRNNEVGSQLPLLGVLALSAQRLLPSVNQIYSGWSGIRSAEAVLNDVLGILNQPMHVHRDGPFAKLNFARKISLVDVSFKYTVDGPLVLKSINMEIVRGIHIGFVGKTGSGKSTLSDIIMGLLVPTHGRVEIDGIPLSTDNSILWHKNIAHVPQHIYLADQTVRENIAFGVEKKDIDYFRLEVAAKIAQIHEFITSLPDAYDTIVGERGVRLSGGQRQRIGIARAIYKNAPVIIFDEATSALDSVTEKAVIRSLREHFRNCTMITIAHRISTVSGCDHIYVLDNGEIVAQGSFAELSNKSKLFAQLASEHSGMDALGYHLRQST